MLSRLIVSPRQIIPLLVASHVSLSFLSIVNSQLLPSEYNELGDDDAEIRECFDASHYRLVQEYVADALLHEHSNRRGSRTGHSYSSTTHDSNKTKSHNIVGVRLGETAIFEDPAFVCRGSNEIREAFRSFRQQVATTPPKCINVTPQGETILLSFYHQQRYHLPLHGTSTSAPSVLEVTVQLQPMKDIPESEFTILHMKQLWRGKPLAWPYPLYYPPRRLNGLLRYWWTRSSLL